MATVELKHCCCHIEIRCLPVKLERYHIQYRTVFDLYGNERLFKWKQFRDSLEVSATPLSDVAELWSHAPFVNPFLDPQQPNTWPDPWHLVIDGKLDDLAICLGMLYTIKLTQRFMDTVCEIHKSMLPEDHDSKFFLVADNAVLNYEPRIAHDLNVLQEIKTDIVWSSSALPINIK
jgi:hypothetical protein